MKDVELPKPPQVCVSASARQERQIRALIAGSEGPEAELPVPEQCHQITTTWPHLHVQSKLQTNPLLKKRQSTSGGGVSFPGKWISIDWTNWEHHAGLLKLLLESFLQPQGRSPLWTAGEIPLHENVWHVHHSNRKLMKGKQSSILFSALWSLSFTPHSIHLDSTLAVFFQKKQNKNWFSVETLCQAQGDGECQKIRQSTKTALLTRRAMSFPLQCAQEHPKGSVLAQHTHERGGESTVKQFCN